MRIFITLLFASICLVANAQDQQTTISVSLDEESCKEGNQYQFNLEICEPKDLNPEVTGLQESQRDWSSFRGIDNSFDCRKPLSQKGCNAVFRVEGHALDKVFSLSIVRFEDGSMEMMKVVIPVQKASDQTEIRVGEMPFKVASVNLLNKLEPQQQKVVKDQKLTLVPSDGAF